MTTVVTFGTYDLFHVGHLNILQRAGMVVERPHGATVRFFENLGKDGLTTVEAGFQPYVIPIAITILVGLFAIQSRGTAKVGSLFGPVMVLWFTAVGACGTPGQRPGHRLDQWVPEPGMPPPGTRRWRLGSGLGAGPRVGLAPGRRLRAAACDAAVILERADRLLGHG